MVFAAHGGCMTTHERIPSLTQYRLLGRSGLRVSPLALGGMTFGTEHGWGAPKETTFALLDRYLESGGNFLDTADQYTGGTSERLIGEYLAERGTRDRVVLATKYSFNAVPGDPNAGGNGRKNLYRALRGSLERLRTDYLDLFWVHAWDGVTPVEEVLSTLDSLVRAGTVRAFGLSDVPAWYASRAQTLAEVRGLERVAGLQLEYSLAERNLEREHAPLALELGLGLTPWSPLSSGLLTGKYTRAGVRSEGPGRLAHVQASGNPAFEKLFTARNWAIVEALQAAATQLARPAAQVAINWVAHRPAVTSTILGASRLPQLEENLRSLEFELPPEVRARLDEVSAPELVHPYHFFEPTMRAMLTGGTSVRRG
jgi:aryl-alcohol dehydrogenase-like predicted oxidoreductase